jgi:hypothetical protein
MLAHGWAGEFTPAKSEGYRLFLDGIDPARLAAAIGTFAERGGEWRPTAVQLLAACGDQRQPEFVNPESVWPLIERAISMVGCSPYDPRFPARHQAAIDWLRTKDEAVAAWAAQRGLCGRGSLGMETVHDEKWGGAVLKRLQGDYAGIRERAAGRLAMGKPAFSPRAFIAKGTSEGGGGIAEIVERLRPKTALNPGTTDLQD